MSDFLKSLFSAKKPDEKPAATREAFALSSLTKAGIDVDTLMAGGDDGALGAKLNSEVSRLQKEASDATSLAKSLESKAATSEAASRDADNRFKALNDQITALGFDSTKPLKDQITARIDKEATAKAVDHSASRGIKPVSADSTPSPEETLTARCLREAKALKK